MKSVASHRITGQLTLSFEPSLPEQFDSLTEFVAHRSHLQAIPQKTIAGKLDMAPSTLSRKLAPKDGDTQRFNCDDLEGYISSTGDTQPIEYLIAKYMQGPNAKKTRVKHRAEELMAELAKILPALSDD